MHQEEQLLQTIISEYESLIGPSARRNKTTFRSERLICDLRNRHDWTDDGARALVTLANDYGAFMLRNALAVAVALGKEDGDLGF